MKVWVFLAIRFGIVAVFLLPAVYIHFRGHVRHTVLRQLTDHSTFLAPYNMLVYLFSQVPTTPRLDASDFPELAPLRENWQVIREEAMRLYEAGHIKGADKRNDIAFNTFFKRGWRRFYLKWYGDIFPSAESLCPRTVELVRNIPSVNAALFAFMPGNSRLGEHRDPFAGSLRYHLGLITPNSDKCRIYIDGKPYSWRDGEAVVFDETYIHSVENETDHDRLILFCDVARPIGNPVFRAINRFVTQHIVKITATNNTEMERIGAVNRLSSMVYALKEFFRSLKKKNRILYYTGKYALFATGIYFVFIRSLLSLVFKHQ